MIYTRSTNGIFDDAGGITFALTTPGTKRDGISLDMEAFQLDNFRRNPTMLWQHGMDPNRGSVPIGKWEGLRHTDGGISGVAVFDTEDDFAMSIKSKFERHFLNAVSIGWLPVRDADGAVTYDLLEASAVAVPADPSALAEGREFSSPMGELMERISRLEAELAVERDARRRGIIARAIAHSL